MRINRFTVLLFIIFIIAALIVTPVLSASSSSQILTPLALTTQGGATSGSLPSLSLLEQSNADDSPSAYVNFSASSGIYSGYFSYQLPLDILPNKVSSFLLQVNFKGPADSTQIWSWDVFNWQSQLWINIGDTIGTQPNVWNNITFRVRNYSSYISSNRQIRLRLQSNNANGDAKVDYQAIHVTYTVVVPTATRGIATLAPTKGVLVFPTTVTPSPTNTPTITPSPTDTLTPTPTKTPTPTRTPTSGSVSTVVFAVGAGGSDVIPHQIVRTNTDNLYIFANQQGSNTLRVYRTTSTGLPNAASAFGSPITPIQVTDTSNIISVDAVYDGETIIHAIVNTQGGLVKDYPFDTSTNTFKPSAIQIAADGHTVGTALYVGTSGVSGAVDLSGKLHITYWRSDNRIIHKVYTYTGSTNVLTQSGSDFIVDTAGSATHPSVAVSPVDGKLTVAWVSNAETPTKILARTRDTNGNWGNVEQASSQSVDVWSSNQNGINIDQGPSLLIDSSGTKHLTYIQECCTGNPATYGLVHYVTNNGSGWTDTPLNIYTHDPALAISTAGNMYIIGHGHPNNIAGDASCRSSTSENNMCYIKKNANGTWGAPVLFAAPPAGSSFDASPSVKWSAVGWNRSNAVEFIFFKTPYDSPTIYYGRLP